MGAQPADRRPAILDLRGVFGLRTKPVTDARHRVAASSHCRGWVLVVRAVVPTAAVNPDNQRRGRSGWVRRRGQDEVEALFRAASADVRKVLEDRGAGHRGEERGHHQEKSSRKATG